MPSNLGPFCGAVRETDHHELLINSPKTAFVWERRHSSVGLEQLISNSSLTNCARFRCVAQYCWR